MRGGMAGRHAVVMMGAAPMRVPVLTVRIVSTTSMLVTVAGRGMVMAGATAMGAMVRMETVATLGVG